MKFFLSCLGSCLCIYEGFFCAFVDAYVARFIAFHCFVEVESSQTKKMSVGAENIASAKSIQYRRAQFKAWIRACMDALKFADFPDEKAG